VRAVTTAALAWALLLQTPVAFATSGDDWWGPDKALHFGAAAAIAVGGYAGASLVVEPRWQRAVFGGALAVGAGAAKEAYDATGAGTPSWKDFTWDVAGALTGVGLALVVDTLLRSGGDTAATGQTGAAMVRF
jgi:putative lipoprotein